MKRQEIKLTLILYHYYNSIAKRLCLPTEMEESMKKSFSILLTLAVPLFCSIILPAILLAADLSTPGDEKPFRVTILDVKQGDALLLISPTGKVILIDAADRTAQYRDKDGNIRTFYPVYDQILPYLERSGISRIDQLFISHAHADHIGGIADLMNHIEIGEVIDGYSYSTNMYKEIVNQAKKKGIPWKKTFRGDTYDWGGGVAVSVLYPPKDMEITPERLGFDEFINGIGNLNNTSVVLRITHGSICYLLTGDAEAEAETEFSTHWADISSTALKAGHHGSRTSSSTGLLEKANPKYAFVSVGEINQFNHPDLQSTIPNLIHYTNKNKGGTYRTDQKGNIETWTYGKDIKIACEKGENVFIDEPRVVRVLDRAVIIEWTTSNPSSTELRCKDKIFSVATPINKHVAVITGLEPEKQYQFVASSKEHAAGKALEAEGTFATRAAPAGAPALSSLEISPILPYFGETVKLDASISRPTPGLRVAAYRDFATPQYQLASVKTGGASAGLEWKASAIGSYTLLIALYKGDDLIDIVERKAAVASKKVLIDKYHWNKHTYRNELSSFKFDLAKNGYEIFENERPLQASALKDIDVLVITDPEKPATQATSPTGSNAGKSGSNPTPRAGTPPQFTDAERAAVTAYVKSGGSLLLTSQSDFKGNVEECNLILAGLATPFRFNDDTVRDITHVGYERVLTLLDINGKIFPPAVTQVLASNSCSLVDAAGGTLTSSDKEAILLLRGGPDNTIADDDGEGNAFQYPSGTPIPVGAAMNVKGGGKIAALGSSYQLSNSVYTHSDRHQTDLFNLTLVKWLTSTGLRSRETDRGAALMETISAGRENLAARSVLDNGAFSNAREEQSAAEDILLDQVHEAISSADFSFLESLASSLASKPREELDAMKPILRKLITALTLSKFEGNQAEGLDEILDSIRELSER